MAIEFASIYAKSLRINTSAVAGFNDDTRMGFNMPITANNAGPKVSGALWTPADGLMPDRLKIVLNFNLAAGETARVMLVDANADGSSEPTAQPEFYRLISSVAGGAGITNGTWTILLGKNPSINAAFYNANNLTANAAFQAFLPARAPQLRFDCIGAGLFTINTINIHAVQD